MSVGATFDLGGDLVYHGGPVMHTNRSYAIYWSPSSGPISASYESLVNQFLDLRCDVDEPAPARDFEPEIFGERFQSG